MDLWQLIFLAVVQGITEFLPISSSGHLILTPKLFGWEDQGVLIDTAVHLGSLFAVLLYFWREVKDAIFGPFYLIGDSFAGRAMRWEAKLALLLIIGTIPVVIFGGALSAMDAVDGLRTIEVIGWTTLIFGIALYIADQYGGSTLTLKDWGWGSAIMIGLAQAIALIPGTSRSGITMTAARALGFERRQAATISMLMAIPAILAASAKGAYDLYKSGDMTLTTDAVIAAVFAFLSAYLALVVMMRMLRSVSFTPFVIYRIALGLFLLSLAYGYIDLGIGAPTETTG